MRRTKRSSRVNELAMSLGLLAGAAVLTSFLSACSATSQGQVALQQETPTGQTAPTGAAQFLGSDAALVFSNTRCAYLSCPRFFDTSGTCSISIAGIWRVFHEKNVRRIARVLCGRRGACTGR